MKFISQSIPDVILIEPIVHEDNRGYFMETYRRDSFEKGIGYRIDFIQDSQSSSSKGVLRGLHYQMPPFAQAKLIRVIKGKILDVVVDIRKSSSTFGKHVAVELCSENKNQLFIPHGFAHGFIVLSDDAVLSYKMDNFYSKDYERTIAYDDQQLNIDWKLNLNEIKVSKKDMNRISLKDTNQLFD
jgi:dTDP-4-dehydrorhamnose 3,5-epimerase